MNVCVCVRAYNHGSWTFMLSNPAQQKMFLSQTRKAHFLRVRPDMNSRGIQSSSLLLQGTFQLYTIIYHIDCAALPSQSTLSLHGWNEKPRGPIEANRIGWDVDVRQICEQVHGLRPLRHALTCRDCWTERNEISFFARFGEQEPQSSLPLDAKGASGDGCIETWTSGALWGWVKLQILGIWSCLATS